MELSELKLTPANEKSTSSVPLVLRGKKTNDSKLLWRTDFITQQVYLKAQIKHITNSNHESWVCPLSE